MQLCCAPWPSSSLLMNALRQVAQTSAGIITGSLETALGAQNVRKKFNTIKPQPQVCSLSQKPLFRTRIFYGTEFCTLQRQQYLCLQSSGPLAPSAFCITFQGTKQGDRTGCGAFLFSRGNMHINMLITHRQQAIFPGPLRNKTLSQNVPEKRKQEGTKRKESEICALTHPRLVSFRNYHIFSALCIFSTYLLCFLSQADRY